MKAGDAGRLQNNECGPVGGPVVQGLSEGAKTRQAIGTPEHSGIPVPGILADGGLALTAPDSDSKICAMTI